MALRFPKKLSPSSDYNASDDGFNGSSGSYIDSEDDVDYQPQVKRARDQTTNKIQRKPTRRPDPKVCNRNAILARENRKRKKELLETLENKVDCLQEDNEGLHKMMKSKDKTISKLKKEVAYLRSVISNQTGIVSVLKAFNAAPIIDSIKKEEYPSSSETASCSNSTADDDGKVLEDPILSDFTDFLSTDFGLGTDLEGIFENPINSMDLFDEPIRAPSPPLSDDAVSIEHNYTKGSPPGVCIHVNGGRYSVEFCSTCNSNALRNRDGL